MIALIKANFFGCTKPSSFPKYGIQKNYLTLDSGSNLSIFLSFKNLQSSIRN